MSNLLTPQEVARELRVEVRLLAEWRVKRVGIPFIKVGHRVRYERAAVDQWISAQRREVRS